jgi:lipoprotein-anchoring transpeptidase ErfK/SrfK
MKVRAFLTYFCVIFATCTAFAESECAHSVIISVPDQKLAVIENGSTVAEYSISTSRYGVGDRRGSYATPVGTLEVANKIGANAPMGAVFKGRHWTGEVLPPNARGRDPIVTRILWLKGLETGNSHAYERGIYIHGTPVERLIGKPASYGCIRMRSKDVVKLFDLIGVGAKINVLNVPLGRAVTQLALNAHRIASL